MVKYLKNFKIIFFGNTKYSTIGAKIINESYPISLFVTIPDREVGKTKELTPSPVKKLAQSLKIPVMEVNKIDSDVCKELKKYSPDFLIVEDYGLILPPSLLAIPKYAPINIHHSLLPKYRGASPAPSTILAGEKISGVSVITMTSEVDAGNILAQQEYMLRPDETTDSLLTQLNKLGGELLVQVLGFYLKGSAHPQPQDHSQATFTQRMKKSDGYFELTNPPEPEKLDRMTRAYYPWPNVWTKWQDKIIKFYPEKRIQIEGKRIVSWEEFKRGYPNFPFNLI